MIMTILGHKSATMSMIYSRISDPEIRRQYDAAPTAGNRSTHERQTRRFGQCQKR
jgi:hypothetical protein